MPFDDALLHDQSAAHSKSAAAAIRAKAGSTRLDLGMVLGTGIGPLADEIEEAVSIPYSEIPHFPSNGVTGHAGRLVIGRLEGRRVAAMQGRAHYYEHGDANAMRVPLEAFALLGAPAVLLTNASGSLTVDVHPADVVAIADHINYNGRNPLIGDGSDHRFVNMVDAYDPSYRAQLKAAAKSVGFDLKEGVYAWYSGPSFETPAEIRMLQILGATLVGMSTVPEVILARRLRLKVAALSMATNFGAGMDAREEISHAQTKRVAALGGARIKALVRAFIREFQP